MTRAQDSENTSLIRELRIIARELDHACKTDDGDLVRVAIHRLTAQLHTPLSDAELREILAQETEKAGWREVALDIRDRLTRSQLDLCASLDPAIAAMRRVSAPTPKPEINEAMVVRALLAYHGIVPDKDPTHNWHSFMRRALESALNPKPQE